MPPWLLKSLKLVVLELKVIPQLLAFINLFLKLTLTVFELSLNLLKTHFGLAKLRLKTLDLLSELVHSVVPIRRVIPLSLESFYEVLEAIRNSALDRVVHLNYVINIPERLSHVFIFTR